MNASAQLVLDDESTAPQGDLRLGILATLGFAVIVYGGLFAWLS